MGIVNEGVINSKITFEQGHIVHETTQPSENIILERNAKLRNNVGAIKDLGADSGETWGRQIASIPLIMFNKAVRDGYQLNHSNTAFANKELFRFLQSTEGKLCLIRGSV